MKITAQARYALRILLDIAVHGGAEPRSIKEIAASQGISEKFISRIAVPLRRAGLVSTERGAKGGLRLAKRPENVSLLAIVVIFVWLSPNRAASTAFGFTSTLNFFVSK